MKDWLARALDLAFAPRARRTCLVHDQAHEYELYYDASGRLMLEFLAGGVGVYAVKLALTREQHDRWVREGPPYIRKLYWELALQEKQGELYPFGVEVAAVLDRDFPEPERRAAAASQRP